MIRRSLSHLFNNSFFLFGARGTGKTTWLKERFSNTPHIWINLLDDVEYLELAMAPSNLKAKIESENIEWVVIDEVQKVPKLLDIVHYLIEEKKIKFALTGSSARKLKRGSANLLAGRAFVYNMHPYTWHEWQNHSTLDDVLHWGSLPTIINLKSEAEKMAYLMAYTKTYLSEEVVAEQLIRRLIPFRRFLPVLANQNGRIINYSKLSHDIGVDDKTVQSYFEILEDTYIGFRLYPYHTSMRKKVRQRPKFYFFDLGVTRCLARHLGLTLTPQTSYYGDHFEHMLILEFQRHLAYFHPEVEMTYICTEGGHEVDLVLDKPGNPLILIEIKSTTQINEADLKTLKKVQAEYPDAVAYCLSQDSSSKQWGKIHALHWQEGLKLLAP